MQITQSIDLNLSIDGIPPQLHMPQGDGGRIISASLWDGSTIYSPPDGTMCMLRFRKPDGTGGLYDTAEDGTKISLTNNVANIPVALQVLAVGGPVRCQVELYAPAAEGELLSANRLATFAFLLFVAPSVYPDAEIISGDYINIVSEALKAALDEVVDGLNEHQPSINADGKWELWDATMNAYVATEYTAIGEDGVRGRGWYQHTVAPSNPQSIAWTGLITAPKWGEGDWLYNPDNGNVGICTSRTDNADGSGSANITYKGTLKGDPGAKGDPGSDAAVTAENIETALGYMPVSEESVNEVLKLYTLNDYVTPEMFGAKGDGVTDDSSAIQTAIDTAGGNKIVYLGKKNYAITTGLSITEDDVYFVCYGTLTYSGTDAAVTINGTARGNININSIHAQNGTALKMTNVNRRVTFNNVNVDSIHASKIGIHLTTPKTGNPIYYNKISYKEIHATEIGVFVETINWWINENSYYGGTIGGGCSNGYIFSGTESYVTGANKVLSGGIEGLSDDGCAFLFNNSENNIVKNVRMLEGYGKTKFKFSGNSRGTLIEVTTCKISEIDITELGPIGVQKNKILSNGASFDGTMRIGDNIEITKKYGKVYDPFVSEGSTPHIKVSSSNFPDPILKPINDLIYTSFQCTVHSSDGLTFTLGEIYYGVGSMLKGKPVTFIFGEVNVGKIKLVDSDGNLIFDNTSGKFHNKTISVRWAGRDLYTGKNIWDITIMEDSGKTIDEIADYVISKIENGNEVSY